MDDCVQKFDWGYMYIFNIKLTKSLFNGKHPKCINKQTVPRKHTECTGTVLKFYFPESMCCI